MIQLRLAEFQVRLLLCTPAGRSAGLLYWNCGCSACACGAHKYEVWPCSDHETLLREVREEEEPQYAFFTGPALSSPSGRPA